MEKVAVVLAPGFEEVEALAVVDILRRANIMCETFSIEDKMITGSHGIKVEADKIFDEQVEEYDMIVLPGGLPGATNLQAHEGLIQVIKKMDSENKWVTAICAAPIVLERADCLVGKNYTSYPGYENELNSGTYLEDLVVVDGNIVTSRGPATVFEFAYTLVEILGGDASSLRKGMLYDLL